MGARIKTERQIKRGQDKKIAREKKKRSLNFAAHCGKRGEKKKALDFIALWNRFASLMLMSLEETSSSNSLR